MQAFHIMRYEFFFGRAVRDTKETPPNKSNCVRSNIRRIIIPRNVEVNLNYRTFKTTQPPFLKIGWELHQQLLMKREYHKTGQMSCAIPLFSNRWGGILYLLSIKLSLSSSTFEVIDESKECRYNQSGLDGVKFSTSSRQRRNIHV